MLYEPHGLLAVGKELIKWDSSKSACLGYRLAKAK